MNTNEMNEKLVSNYLNAVEVDRVPAGGRVGVAEYKMAEAMEMA